METKITLTKPDDWHIHLRDGDVLQTTVNHAAHQFGRAIVMPNLVPPVTTTELADAYHSRIKAHIPPSLDFTPLMTLYLTDNTNPHEIQKAHDSGIVTAVKYYPAGATTNSDSGVTELTKTFKVLETMQKIGMPLLVHGEVTNAEVDIFDREKFFLDEKLATITKQFPNLKVVLEHITTKDGIDFVLAQGPQVGGTITAHHLLLNRNDMLVGGIKPHHYCLPILKRAQHQQALIDAATSGNPKFFLGTDSAPHSQDKKECASGCAGVYTAHAALALYAQAFEAADALDKLEGFASFHGPDFYGLPRNTDTITLERQSWQVPHAYSFGHEQLVPFCAGEMINYRIIK